MARLGDNPIGLCTNKTPSIFPFLFHPPIPKSVNLLKLAQGRDVAKQIRIFLLEIGVDLVGRH